MTIRLRLQYKTTVAVAIAACCAMLGYALAQAWPGAAPHTIASHMVRIAGGSFVMGSASRLARHNEQPPVTVALDDFWIADTDVTNAQFTEFVLKTGYVTTAERAPSPDALRAQLPPGTPLPDPALLPPGALVFHAGEAGGAGGAGGAVPLDDWSRWWRYVPGANWRHPDGPASGIAGKADYPVVQVSHDDAQAYAHWAGMRLPTEAEWEYAARGGLQQADYAWGGQFKPDGRAMANTFPDAGRFPAVAIEYKAQLGTSKVRSYPPNGYGLYDMTGNVWQWVADRYRADQFARLARAGDAPRNPAGPADSDDPDDTAAPRDAPKHVIRGGSFLCDESYCRSYRPSARRGNDPANPMSHIGFRVASSVLP